MATDRSKGEATRLLITISSDGDSSDSGPDVTRMFSLVYDELRGLAQRLMRREAPEHTLRPTALVHEAYIRLVESEGLSWENRAHFFGIAARAMRQILVDHARARDAIKRGGGVTRVSIEKADIAPGITAHEIIDLERAIEKLTPLDARMARVVEMRLFAGLSIEEIACALRTSRRTIQDDWKMARLFLSRELSAGRSG